MVLRISIMLLFCFPVAAQPFAEHNLKFSKLPEQWDEALPLGNGMVGALIWKKDGKLRISLDRSDLWDLRPTADLDKLDFAAVQRHLKANTYQEVQKLGDVPYERDPAPTKIPGAALEFDIGPMDAISAGVNISNGTAQLEWSNNVKFLAFVHPNLPIGWFRFDRTDVRPTIVPPLYTAVTNNAQGNSVEGQGLARLGYAQGILREHADRATYTQPGWNGFEYQVAVHWWMSDGKLEGVWAITSNYPDTDKTQTAESLTLAAKGRFNQDIATTMDWWHMYWGNTSIQLPDPVLERQWYLEQYKFGCVARSNAPPITLQAIWTADNGNLPPWKGDIHNDLNLQLSYWPAYTGNHLEEAEGMVNWLHRSRPEFERWTKQYFGKAGLNAPGVTTLDGKAMGGWIQYSLSPTTAGWLGHHFYLHWRYSMDRKFLKDKAYPWIRDFATFIQNLSVPGANGKHKLPISSSPEFYDNAPKAWFAQTTNYDLAIIRWTFTKASELAAELGLKSEAEDWKKELSRWPELAQDPDGALSLAPGQPYPESHRHFSHLLGIHPLGLIRNDPAGKKIMEASVSRLMEQGTKAWVGYSFAWLGSIYARMRDGDKAAEMLRTFATCFCLPNSFHANGDQCGGRHSSYTYRPFTLEGNFAFASGIQEMLLQSHDGVIRVFPAIPATWKEVSFKELRAEGGFILSARRSNGSLAELNIRSEQGGAVLIEDIPSVLILPAQAVRRGTSIRIQMEPGQELMLKNPGN